MTMTMEFRSLLVAVFLAVGVFAAPGAKSSLHFTIDKTWDGQAIAPEVQPFQFTLTPNVNSKDFNIQVTGPYFGDPVIERPQGQSFIPVYDQEVVEFFFLNDNTEYVEIELSPKGVYYVLLLKGVRNKIRYSLPIEFQSTINGDTWTGEAVIPGDYLPPQVTKFNAYAIHGTGDKREYWALYPTDGTTAEPDFHKLEFFQPIDLSELGQTRRGSSYSPLWQDAVNGIIEYKITKTWDGKPAGLEIPYEILLKGNANSRDLNVTITAPYFGDPAPPFLPGLPTTAIHPYEILELYFLNDTDQYFVLHLGPHGHYNGLLLDEWRHYKTFYLPLTYTATINGSTWVGEAFIPGDYFPSKVTKFNAYAQHGEGEERKYYSLYPTDGTTIQPDFHDFSFFNLIDMPSLDKAFGEPSTSVFWQETHNMKITYNFTQTWDGKPVNLETPFEVTLRGHQGSREVSLVIEAPYFGDAAPATPPPFKRLNDFEVVEVYFLNDENQYLQLVLGPHGHYNVFLLDGMRVFHKKHLYIDYKATINGSTWIGKAHIPSEYFPSQVTKFNAFAQNGEGEGRQYYALYPTDGTTLQPDFHNLTFFRPIDMTVLDQAFQEPSTSNLWQKNIALKIDKTWNGEEIIGTIPVSINITGSEDSKDLKVTIEAPYFNDPVPSGSSGPFLNLWDYEVVQLFFLNEADQYLDVEVGPHGHYIAMLLDGERNTIRQSLPLDVTTSIRGNKWEATLTIPGDYLPPQTVKMNAYAIHGVGSARKYWALYPAPKEEVAPNFHNLRLFQRVNLPISAETITSTHYSPIWQTSLQGGRSLSARMLEFEITREWNSRKPELPSISTTLQGFEGGVEMNYTIRLTDSEYTLSHFVLIFESADANSLKIRLEPNGSYALKMFGPNNKELNSESFPLDYRVTTVADVMKGSALVPPTYFPPLVNMVNIYAVFGTEKQVAMSLRPLTLVAGLLRGGKPDLDSKEHFRPIDFDLLVKSNLDLSDIWRKLLTTKSNTRIQNERRKSQDRPRVNYFERKPQRPAYIPSQILRQAIPKRKINRDATKVDSKNKNPQMIDNEYIFDVSLVDVEAIVREDPRFPSRVKPFNVETVTEQEPESVTLLDLYEDEIGSELDVNNGTNATQVDFESQLVEDQGQEMEQVDDVTENVLEELSTNDKTLNDADITMDMINIETDTINSETDMTNTKTDITKIGMDITHTGTDFTNTEPDMINTEPDITNTEKDITNPEIDITNSGSVKTNSETDVNAFGKETGKEEVTTEMAETREQDPIKKEGSVREKNGIEEKTTETELTNVKDALKKEALVEEQILKEEFKEVDATEGKTETAIEEITAQEEQMMDEEKVVKDVVNEKEEVAVELTKSAESVGEVKIDEGEREITEKETMGEEGNTKEVTQTKIVHEKQETPDKIEIIREEVTNQKQITGEKEKTDTAKDEELSDHKQITVEQVEGAKDTAVEQTFIKEPAGVEKVTSDKEESVKLETEKSAVVAEKKEMTNEATILDVPGQKRVTEVAKEKGTGETQKLKLETASDGIITEVATTDKEVKEKIKDEVNKDAGKQKLMAEMSEEKETGEVQIMEEIVNEAKITKDKEENTELKQEVEEKTTETGITEAVGLSGEKKVTGDKQALEKLTKEEVINENKEVTAKDEEVVETAKIMEKKTNEEEKVTEVKEFAIEEIEIKIKEEAEENKGAIEKLKQENVLTGEQIKDSETEISNERVVTDDKEAVKDKIKETVIEKETDNRDAAKETESTVDKKEEQFVVKKITDEGEQGMQITGVKEVIETEKKELDEEGMVINQKKFTKQEEKEVTGEDKTTKEEQDEKEVIPEEAKEKFEEDLVQRKSSPAVFNKPLLYLLTQSQLASTKRKTSQRFIEDSNTDKNTLTIPFKISVKSKEQLGEEQQEPSSGMDSQALGTSSIPIKDYIDETSIKQDTQNDDISPSQVMVEDEVQPEYDDLVGTNIDSPDYDTRILPPPHPLCFAPGLVPDRIRCQIFYECVIENGQWEVYNWRCKRGYFYDPVKVACIRGVC